MYKPELAGTIDGALLAGDITEQEADLAHSFRQCNIPACFGNYDSQITDCQRQDIIACQICKKVKEIHCGEKTK